MENVLTHQTQMFLFAAILGMLLGVLYDVFRCLARAFRMGRVAMAVQDLLFCLLCLLSFILFMLIFAQGQVRWYIPGGMAIGGALYFTALTGLVRAGLLPLIRLLRRAAAKCRRFLVRAFSAPRGN